MNYVHVVGRLGKDPEVRFTSDNQKVTTFTVAANYRKGGQDETIWWRVTVWGDRWDKMMQYLSKGKLVMIGGEMRKPETYVNKSGQTQISNLEVTADYIKFVPGAKQEEGETGQSQQSQTQAGQFASTPATETGTGTPTVEEEPLPF